MSVLYWDLAKTSPSSRVTVTQISAQGHTSLYLLADKSVTACEW